MTGRKKIKTPVKDRLLQNPRIGMFEWIRTKEIRKKILDAMEAMQPED